MKPHRYQHPLFIALVAFVLTSCSTVSRLPGLDFTTQNASGVDLDWVRVVWGDWQISSGVLPVGVDKVMFDTRRREPPQTDVATVTFVEDVSRQRHSIPIDVSKVRQLRDGIYMVTFRITSLSEAEIIIEPEKK